MKRTFGTKRPTIRQLQDTFNLYAPPDQDAAKLPDFMSETPRAQGTEPRQHTESDFLRNLLKTARAYYEKGIVKICLRRNNNIVARLADGRVIRAGLGVGTSDSIGYVSRTVTQEMVGKSVAVFTAIEAKARGKNPDNNQQAFLDQVNRDGGIGLCARDGDDIYGLIQRLAK